MVHSVVYSDIDARAAMERASTPPALPHALAAEHAGLGQPKALMGVGGAAFVAGALIGGDAGAVFMVGGAAVGLYGLYEYLK
jgi:hypothetical protein